MHTVSEKASNLGHRVQEKASDLLDHVRPGDGLGGIAAMSTLQCAHDASGNWRWVVRARVSPNPGVVALSNLQTQRTV